MRAIYPILLCVLLCFSVTAEAQIQLETSARQAIVVDYDTGAVLLDKNADEKMPTSSMSKVMSMLVVFDALQEGHMKLDDTLMVSEKAWRKQGSKMFVEVDKRVKVEDLIRGVVVQSGNDATIVLAEGVAGSEDAFAQLLNKKALDLGMTSSQFKNASGWPDPDHYSTARDLSTMAVALIRDYPEYYKYYSEKEFTYNKIKQGNRNPLLYRNIGADGIKTGHTEAGGYGVIGSGTRDGRRVIIIVNGLESSKDRASESAKLLEWGLQFFTNKVAVKAGEAIGQAPVKFGKENTVSLTTSEDVLVTTPKMSAKDIKVEVYPDANISAPITKGQRLGTVQVTVKGQEPIERPLIAAADVEQLGFFWRSIENLITMITAK